MSRQFSEDEMRALEAEMERISVDDVLIQTTVTLLNLAAGKAGLGDPAGASPPAPDWDQVRQAIEGARALIPLLEDRHAEQLGPVRDMLSQLQMIYAQQAHGGGGGPLTAAERPGAEPSRSGQPGPSGQPDQDGPGPAQSSGRLWVPGQ